MEPLPGLDAFPKGSRYHLLVDCETSNVAHWLEVGWDGHVHRLGRERPLPLGPGDLVLSAPRANERERKHERIETTAIAALRRMTGIPEHEIDAATRLLSLLERAGVHHVERAHQLRDFQCGYYDMHLAAGGRDPKTWREVLRDGTPGKLSSAVSKESVDIFSGDVVVRPG